MGSDKTEEKKQPLQEGYQPFKKGYQPTQSDLDTSKPPQGGSGVPSKPSSSSDSDKKADKK